jgi:hypothetical protein
MLLLISLSARLAYIRKDLDVEGDFDEAIVVKFLPSGAPLSGIDIDADKLAHPPS